MLNWLLSRPLQIKFFVSSTLLVSAALLVLMLNVFQVLNLFLSHQIEDDMEQRSHILAMTLMVGPAAHNQNDLQQLLHDVTVMHGYCYLAVLNTEDQLLASAGNMISKLPAASGAALANERNDCFDGSIQLIHDGKPFGTLRYGVDTSFFGDIEHRLRGKLFIIAVLWFAIGTAVYYFLVRKLVKPLQAITLASESMAHGNLNAAMPMELPQDELGKLAVSFSNMAAALRERVESQQSYAHALYAEQARLNALITILPVGIVFVDPSRRVQFINHECRRLWGLSESEDYFGKQDTELISLALKAMEHPEQFKLHLDAALNEFVTSAAFDTILHNGQMIRSRSCVVPDAAGNGYIGRIWMFEDVTAEHARLHKAQALAERDALTGLYNRRRFEEDIELLFAQVRRNGQCLTLMYFDLDDFKNINDAHGHAAGDKVLKGIAQALSSQSRRNENLYRLGGDEFALLIADAEHHQIEALAQRVITTVENLQFNFLDHLVHIRCSMGIAACSTGILPGSAAELLQQADSAMYQAKQDGKNRWHFFNTAHALDLSKDSR